MTTCESYNQHNGVSFDGDADRIVFFMEKEGKKIDLVDGDRISVLYAKTISHFLNRLTWIDEIKNLRVGAIHTGYANNSAVLYMKNVLKIETHCCPTGVKYSQNAAKKYDIGIYFESNGHGTIEYHQSVLKKLIETSNQPTLTPTQKSDLLLLISFLQVL